MIWRDMICINKMNGIKSEHVMSLCMLPRHYISCTICACHISHIMKLFIPGTFYNLPYWQAYV